MCPCDAIDLTLDIEGFRYPRIDKARCTNCGLCEKACHMLQPLSVRDVFEGIVYAACMKERRMLTEVSSGGAAWELAQEIIRQGGVVYGAKQESLFHTTHERAEDLKQAEAFRRSKYQESNMGKIFRRVRADVDAGRPVLFTGTGCQVAGLYAFLGERPSCLTTCDMVCHSIPSLAIFKAYIASFERKQRGKARNIVYRDKSLGWKRNQIAIYFEDGRVFKQLSDANAYHSSYLDGLISRPSCEDCRYQALNRVSDITVADFWKYDGELCRSNAGYEDSGISLVVCTTARGRALFAAVCPRMEFEEVPVEQAIASSNHLTSAAPFNSLRSIFFASCRVIGFRTSHMIYIRIMRLMKFLRKCKEEAF